MGGVMMPYLGVLASLTISNPNQLPNLNLYYDASVANATNFGSNIPTSGGGVKTWVDNSGAGHDANQSVSAKQPLWNSNQQNGLGTISWSTSQLLTINPIAWAQSLPGATTYIVMKANSLAAAMDWTTTNTGGFRFFYDGTNYGIAQSGGVGTATSLATTTTGYHIMGLVFDGTQTGNANRLKFRYDGGQQTLNFGATTVGTTTNASATTLYLGCGNNGSSLFLNGAIGEMLIWTRTLNNSEIGAVETYLSTKWNL